MPHKQRHRGQHPEDDRLFSEAWLPRLRQAVADLSYLFSRGYAEKAAQKLVGDHHQLDVRQRRAVLGAACPDASLAWRQAHALSPDAVAGRTVTIDGYNILIAVECALAGGILLRGTDGCIRDLASIHGSYHKVEETLPAVHLIGEALDRLGVAQANWYFDAPVSNSGRLKVLLESEAAQAGWKWRVELARNTDKVLAASEHIVATSDSWILDRAKAWCNLKGAVLRWIEPAPEVIDLGPSS